MSVKKNKKEKLVLRKQVIIIGIIIILIIGLIKFIEFRQKQLERKITVEGIVKNESRSCLQQSSKILGGHFFNTLLFAPEPYLVSGPTNVNNPKKYASNYIDKRIRVSGIVDGTLSSVCIKGKKQEIPLLKVTDIEPLE